MLHSIEGVFEFPIMKCTNQPSVPPYMYIPVNVLFAYIIRYDGIVT